MIPWSCFTVSGAVFLYTETVKILFSCFGSTGGAIDSVGTTGVVFGA